MADNHSLLPERENEQLPTNQARQPEQSEQPELSASIEEQPTSPILQAAVEDLPTMQVPALSDGQAGPANQPATPMPTAQQNQTDQQAPSARPGQGNANTVALYQQPAPAMPQGALPSGETAEAQQQTIVATRGPDPVISVRDLRKTYILGKKTQVPALRGVSLEIYPGEFVAIMGPSGSGKSTFMNQLGCLDRPSAGEYWLAGRLVSNLSSDELARVRNRLIGFVFQGFNLLGRATALSNVALPAVYAGVPRKERERRARKLLQLVGLGGRLHHKPPELSGGQQQRVAIARALVNGPALLLADEPTGNLDSRTSVEIMGVLQALNEQGLTIVLVTHDPKIAAYAKRQVSFLDGRIVRDEPTPAPRSAQAEWSALLAEEAKNAAGATETTAQEGTP